MAYDHPEAPKPAIRKDVPRGTPATICAWNDHGETCGHPGIASFATTGTGSWYCREHWYRLRGFAGMEGKRGNQMPAEIHSYAVEILQAKLKARREFK